MENNLTVFMPVYNGEKYIKNALIFLWLLQVLWKQ